MKRPYLNETERQSIYLDTLSGDFAMVDLRLEQLIREIKKSILKHIYYIVNTFKIIINFDKKT